MLFSLDCVVRSVSVFSIKVVFFLNRSQNNPSKDGSFSAKLELDAGREYQFRYLIDGSRWENDWKADKYIPAPY